MPWMQAVVERANTQFRSANIANQTQAQKASLLDLLAPGKALVDAAAALEIVTNKQERDHFDVWPSSLKEALRATLHDAVNRGVPVQFSWRPAAGFGIAVWEAAGSGGSSTAITVELRSPMP